MIISIFTLNVLLLNIFGTDISSCQNLNISDTYVLTQDLSTTGTCFKIGASDIILDLNGHTITGDGGSSDYGIWIDPNMNSGYSNIMITNGSISSFGDGIHEETTYNNFEINNINFINSLNNDLNIIGMSLSIFYFIYFQLFQIIV